MEKVESNNDRIFLMDFLRCYAILGVLIIHSSTRYAANDFEMMIGGWFSTFSRPCIAIFLFISGFLLSDRFFGYNELLIRIKRVLYPYIFFSFFAFLYRYGSRIFTDLPILISDILLDTFFGRSFGIYYFVFVIICTYVLWYLINLFNQVEVMVYNWFWDFKKSMDSSINISIFKVFIFFILILLIHCTYYNDVVKVLVVKKNVLKYYHNSYIFWPVYFLCGVIVNRKKLINIFKEHKLFLVSVFLFVFIVYNFIYWGKIDSSGGYNSLIGSLYSFVFIFMICSLEDFLPQSRVIITLSELSFYLYLSHIFVVYLLFDFFKAKCFTPNLIFAIPSFVLSFALPVIFFYFQRIFFKGCFNIILGVR